MLNLPDQPHDPFDRPPLALVVCQVNYVEVGDVGRREARFIQEALGPTEWPSIKPIQILGAMISPAGVSQQAARQGQRLESPSGSRAVGITPDCVTLEAVSYPGWEAFSSELRRVLDAVGETLVPDMAARVGLRYLNQVHLPKGKTDWTDLVPSELLGLNTHEVLGPGVIATEQRAVLDLSDSVRCLFRYGNYVDETAEPTFLLDYDVFTEVQTKFAVDDLLATANDLHSKTWGLFLATTTEELRESFK
jgi:uncharacterized protein (TIGR04255 family)